mmetsp:Transcript_3072/g.5698  ORF Transcript_3072/g.5698 Transcript_3072/m.5698 type:complete len:574 (-) Transcript_3072:170-1891(-)
MWEVRGRYVGDTIKTTLKSGDDVHIRHGTGEFQYANRNFKFQGDWHLNVKHGKGRLNIGKPSSAGSSYYEGDFQDGEMSGHGTRKWADGKIYTGGFKMGHFHGKGKLVTKEYTYKGEFSFNQKQGTGEITWQNGDSYRGEFSQNFPHGEGQFVQSDGLKMYDGEWERLEKWIVTAKELKVYDKCPRPLVTSRLIATLKKGEVFLVKDTKDTMLHHAMGWSSLYDASGVPRAALVFRKGLRHGIGTERTYKAAEKDGGEKVLISEYQGEFMEDKRHGDGEFVHFPSGYKYRGDFKYGKPEVEAWYLKMNEEVDGIMMQPAPIVVGEPVNLHISTNNYDGSPNICESNRVFTIKGRIIKEASKGAPEEKTVVFGFMQNSEDFQLENCPENYRRSVSEQLNEGVSKPKFEEPVYLREDMPLVLMRKPQPPQQEEKVKITRRRKKKEEEKKSISDAIGNLPTFEVLRKASNMGFAWTGDLTIDESLSKGTEIEIEYSDTTENLDESQRVCGGKAYKYVVKVVDAKEKAAIIKKATIKLEKKKKKASGSRRSTRVSRSRKSSVSRSRTESERTDRNNA